MKESSEQVLYADAEDAAIDARHCPAQSAQVPRPCGDEECEGQSVFEERSTLTFAESSTHASIPTFADGIQCPNRFSKRLDTGIGRGQRWRLTPGLGQERD